MATVILRPNADFVTGLSRNAEDANWKCVDEVISDEWTTIVYLATPDEPVHYQAYDYYELPNPGLDGIINSVKVFIRCAKLVGWASDGNAWSLLLIGGIEYPAVSYTLTTSFVTNITTYNLNPKTGVAWTWADIDALAAGVFLDVETYDYSAEWVACTQLYVEVDYTLPMPSSPNMAAKMVAAGVI